MIIVYILFLYSYYTSISFASITSRELLLEIDLLTSQLDGVWLKTREKLLTEVLL
jgi:hypothetical protein